MYDGVCYTMSHFSSSVDALLRVCAHLPKEHQIGTVGHVFCLPLNAVIFGRSTCASQTINPPSTNAKNIAKVNKRNTPIRKDCNLAFVLRDVENV